MWYRNKTLLWWLRFPWTRTTCDTRAQITKLVLKKFRQYVFYCIRLSHELNDFRGACFVISEKDWFSQKAECLSQMYWGLSDDVKPDNRNLKKGKLNHFQKWLLLRVGTERGPSFLTPEGDTLHLGILPAFVGCGVFLLLLSLLFVTASQKVHLISEYLVI